MEETLQKLKNYFLFLLSKQDYSIFKLQQKAQQKQYPSEVIQQVIQEFLDKGYIRETIYAKSKTLAWYKKGISVSMIQRKLSMEKVFISAEEIKNWLCENQCQDDAEMTQTLVAKKMKNIDFSSLSTEERLKIKDKALRYLVSKGHSFDVAKDAIKQYIQSNL
jgi:regulatory protein